MNKKNTKKEFSSIEKKLKMYSALAAGLIVFTNSSEAQIVYTDIVDAVISDNNYFLLDLNNDGSPDFNLIQSYTDAYSHQYRNYVLAYPVVKANRMLDTVFNAPFSSLLYAPALNLNASIGPNPGSKLEWTSSNNDKKLALDFEIVTISTSALYPYYYGFWQGVTDKYLGLSFVVNNKTYYGWARLDVSKDGKSFTIKDYAYNSTPGDSILAGDKGGDDIAKVEPRLKPIIYTHNKDIYINFNINEPIRGTISILSLTGQLLKTSEIVKDENIIRLDEIASGIYLLNIQTSKGNISRKIHL